MALGGFQKTCLIIAVVFLIILLIVIAVALLSGRAAKTWPPEVSNCPDWWLSDGSGNLARCLNPKKIGTCDGPANFTTKQYTGDNGICNKYKWANNCKVAWDGITYGVPNPCNS
jgi:hypothetical protein